MEATEKNRKENKRCYVQKNPKGRRLSVATRRMSMNKKWRERRRLRKMENAAYLSSKDGKQSDEDVKNVIEAVACKDESCETLPSTSAVSYLSLDFKNEGNIEKHEKDDIVEKVDLDENLQEVNNNNHSIESSTLLLELNGRPMYTEIPETATLNKACEHSIRESVEVKIHDNAPSDQNSGCNWVVESVKSQETEQPISEGRDFVDFAYVFNQMMELGKHSNIGCGIEHFKIVGSQRNGLENVYIVQCQMCNHFQHIQCLRKNDNIMDINLSVVSATMVTGSGYNQLEELLTGINVACMSKNRYQKCQDEIINAFELAAQQEMEDAAKQERELAVARGDVHHDSNIPWIAVVADGSWMKRSYRGGYYNSLSGVGAIVGYHTKKVLYIGVKNKFCIICQTAAKKKEEAREHHCFKNWGRGQSSTGMESAAIVEGFKCSIQMHSLIYSVLVADGDSSVYKKILDNDPYKDYMVHVRKIECTNHLLRSFNRRINEIATKGRHKELRDIVKRNTLRLRTGIKKAAKYRFEEKISLADQIKNFEIDLKNVPSHVFGEHKECQKLAYFCNKYSDLNEKDYVPQLKETGIYQSIEEAMQPLFAKAENLLYDLNNNAVECFNSIIAKFIGGKRINFGRKGSYQGRVSAAVVQFNSKNVLSRLSVAMNKQPTSIVKNMEERRRHASQMAMKYKQKVKRSTSRYDKHLCDEDYGLNT